MADTDPPAGTPDPVVTDENLLYCLHSCLTFVARFTMQPVHFEVYRRIVDNFNGQNVPYGEFRVQMVALLQQNSNYAHLGVYWDVFDRVINGEEQMLQENSLFLYPVALYVLLNLIHYSAQIRDPLWNVEQERILASQRELSRIRRRRYRTAGEDPIRALNPDVNPEWNLFVLLDWFQDCGAGIVMGSEDCDCHAKWAYGRWPRRRGLIPDANFMEELGALLQNPNGQFLRLWWHIHRKEVCGVRWMVDVPILRFPLALWFTLNIVRHFATFGYTLWNLFLNTVRRRRP